MAGSFAKGLWAGFVVLPITFWSGQALAADPASDPEEPQPMAPVVLGFERFHGQSEDPALDGGRLLLGELNCLSCHAGNSNATKLVETKKAPILDEVGARVRVDYLRKFLNDPQSTK